MADELPFRSGLISADQMERHGKTLASAHKISLLPHDDGLLARLDQNETVLIRTRALLTEAVKDGNRITPAGEWLLDNFYLIEEQIRATRRHLPRGYSRELPRLVGGASAEAATGLDGGLPRVYDIALTTIACGDGRVDLESLNRFVSKYQTIAPLNLGELWAIPIMLRLALIENLRRVASTIANDMANRNLAAGWADKMVAKSEKDPKSLILVIADMARSNPPLNGAFVSELARRLQWQSPALAMPLTWIEQHLAETGLTIEQLIQTETQYQASNQVSISNTIGSLRLLGAHDWSKFVEEQSLVEHTLLDDPAAVYGAMNFATRDMYRHIVERFARETKKTEIEIAQLALTLAAEARDEHQSTENSDRLKHVGYYLLDAGREKLLRRACGHIPPAYLMRLLARRSALCLYLVSIATVTATLAYLCYIRLQSYGLDQPVIKYFALFCSIVLGGQLGIELTNRLAQLIKAPAPLPRMDFDTGIPHEATTLVVVPTMISGKKSVEQLIDSIEVRFLANQDKNIYFALLTDFTDSQSEAKPDDDELIQLAREGIFDLNQKYRGREDRQGDPFFLLHRPRLFNPSENTWMGRERKRGKLGDLNALLRDTDGSAEKNFSAIVGSKEILPAVKYVVTLDTDTQLPRDSARELVAAMEHPLNKPVVDSAKKVVTEGYGLLQPRVSNSLSGARQSLFSLLHCRDAGIDPYTKVVSDIYQDLFKEGSFIGKGIYNVDAFETALKDRFPDNRILSHDLLEGSYVRSGLISDVEFFEEYPSTYTADVSRRHRWIRGDWQIIDWLAPKVPTSEGKSETNPLSLLARYKIFDNLRRSITAPVMVATFVLGWTALADHWLWTLLPLTVIFLPPVLSLLSQLLNKPEEIGLKKHLLETAKSAITTYCQVLLNFVCLPFEAYFSFDAITTTCYRVFGSKKNLLIWQASSATERIDRARNNIWAKMSAAPIMSTGIFLFLLLRYPESVPQAAPILLLWFLAPAMAGYISRPLPVQESALNSAQKHFLFKLARKTWAFFELLVVEGDNHLPPDNYQLEPVEVIAHRTSPTNIGMSLLSALSACDFGFITEGDCLERTARTLKTMSAMDRHRGHFFNWYDTKTLEPLKPLYISTVDSGNLAGHLLVLKMGLGDFTDRKIVSPSLVHGLAITFDVLQESLKVEADAAILSDFAASLKNMRSNNDSLSSIYADLGILCKHARNLANEIEKLASDRQGDDPIWWAKSLANQCQKALDDLIYLCPWLLSENQKLVLELLPDVDRVPTLSGLSRVAEAADNPKIRPLLDLSRKRAQDRLLQIADLVEKLDGLAKMDFTFLYDRSRRLLSIGYNVEERRLDNSYYDLLASEARLANFVAIANGQLPEESWFALGRLLMGSDAQPVLGSWSGSMFEYLMPLLVMPTYENTLLDQTYKSVISKQIEYGLTRSVPWGISESGYNQFDAHLNYQYKAFGVPGLGLKRGLGDDLVIAPYASVMALMVEPEKAYYNLKALASQGLVGQLGFYEAIDCTPRRLAARQLYAVVKSFMAHHQGMSLLSLAYLLLDKPMQKAFEQEPSLKATLPLLQERIPKSAVVPWHSDGDANLTTTFEARESPVRVIKTPNTTTPEVQLLSNGRYSVMITNSGAGYSRWKDIAVTRWRPDTTLDNWGSFCYIKEIGKRDNSDSFWSAAYQPAQQPSENFEAIFSEARVEFRRRDGDIDTHYEIVVSSEDDIELRRVQLTNRSRNHKIIELTSYGEVVMTSPDTDSMHPAFSNLFVQTEIIEKHKAILCSRRPRSESDIEPWMFHLMVAHGAEEQSHSYETDRMRFVGRGNTPQKPEAMLHDGPLSNTSGSVLDPIVSSRSRIILEPHASATVDIVTGVADTKEACLQLMERYKDKRLADRVFEVSWTHNQVVLRQINATDGDAQLYGRLAGAIIYPNASFRADASVLIKNRRGQSSLWGYAISGDLPIVLVQVRDGDNLEIVRQLVQAHAYWRLKGLIVDLVIWNEDHGGYRQLLQEQILGIVAVGVVANVIDRPGGIFVRIADQISAEDRILFQSVARAIISDNRGSLEEQILNRPLREARVPLLVPSKSAESEHQKSQESSGPPRELVLDNGLGGFTTDGREYVITLAPGARTPAPWCNVMANSYFGSVISEAGASYTWAENAHEYRLSPWHDDPVSDLSGEAYYIRDEETGKYWSPTPFPCWPEATCVSRHGFGYSVFEMQYSGIRTEYSTHTAIDAPVKFVLIKLKNNSGRQRKLSCSGYLELVLGDMRSKTNMHVVTELDTRSGAVFARNSYNTEFAERVAFFDVDDTTRTFTGDRAEFIGRNGSLKNPTAMTRRRLSGKIGASLDPCAAIQLTFDLADGQEKEIVFRIGSGRDGKDASQLVTRFRGVQARHDSFERLCQYWKHTLGTVNVQTPDTALNMLANGWLLYQTIGCRLWARSGYYQSGGAFGFRDQLQDSLALLHAEPTLLRQQILLCASRQFVEGDVQHWWHPPSGRGVRTHCSDDYLWLPLATCRYVLATGDTGILDENIHFLTGRLVYAEEESYYDLPGRSEEKATLYDHCVRAIDHGLTMGKHGLPLIGCGDWNDGMNLVGEKGEGESVWLAFFLYSVLLDYIALAKLREDEGLAQRLASAAETLQQNIEANAWDGQWYRRAYFDDGTPLGSSSNEECQIDSIAQSWSVLSKAAPEERRDRAMQSLYERLVDKKAKIVKLLDPPFDKGALNPGYIKGYVPGVRENGGQYTHSAIWATMAFAALGESEKAWELFSMINPVQHAVDSATTQVYKVEPYVVAADVYGVAPHVGRGGWTWYTGSAGWMYRLIIESLLGIHLEIDKLYIKPCLPANWSEYTVHYRFRETVYHIVIKQIAPGSGQAGVTVDGQPSAAPFIPLIDDRREHRAEVIALSHSSVQAK